MHSDGLIIKALLFAITQELLEQMQAMQEELDVRRNEVIDLKTYVANHEAIKTTVSNNATNMWWHIGLFNICNWL